MSFIWPSARETSRLTIMDLSWSELLQTSIRQISSAAAISARFTGSRRRMSSAAWASASRFKRIGILVRGLYRGQRGANRHGELGGDLFQFCGLLWGQFGFQKSGRV